MKGALALSGLAGRGTDMPRAGPEMTLDAAIAVASISPCRKVGPVGGNTCGNRSLIAQW
jgi:hypothetical protein